MNTYPATIRKTSPRQVMGFLFFAAAYAVWLAYGAWVPRDLGGGAFTLEGESKLLTHWLVWLLTVFASVLFIWIGKSLVHEVKRSLMMSCAAMAMMGAVQCVTLQLSMDEARTEREKADNTINTKRSQCMQLEILDQKSACLAMLADLLLNRPEYIHQLD